MPKKHLEKKPLQGRLLVHLETFLERSTNEITVTPQEIASKPHQREKCLRLYKLGTQWYLKCSLENNDLSVVRKYYSHFMITEDGHVIIWMNGQIIIHKQLALQSIGSYTKYGI